MTRLTASIPDAATAEIVEHIRRVGGAVSVDAAKPSAGRLQLPPLTQLTAQQEADIDRIIARGGDPVGSVELVHWYEAERERELIQPRPGYEQHPDK